MNHSAGNEFTAIADALRPGATPMVWKRRRTWRQRFHRAAVCAIALEIVLAALLSGLRLRKWLWVHTDAPHPSWRFDYDLENAYHWGSQVLRRATEKAIVADAGGKPTDWRYFIPAYVGIYDEVVKDHPDGEYQLDYTPARLLVDALWVRHMRLAYPHVNTWVRPYNYNYPLLWTNTICEMLAALGAFLLVRHWVWRGTLAPTPLYRRRRDQPLPALPPAPSRAWVLALLAALLIWFNPAVLFDAHVFPQWEVWLLPSFFFAAWLASKNWWFTAGLLIPIGVLLKGQLSMVLPFFILWPLLERRPLAALRFVLGLALAAALMLSPWLARGSLAWHKVSFDYPTHHWKQMAIGESDNLASLLGFPPFGWELADPVFTLRLPPTHLHWVVTIKTLLVIIYTFFLVLCAWGAAVKSRRNDPAFLIALTAPWVLLFAVLPQMHERYLLWAAAVSATTVALGFGWLLLHLFVTAEATLMIVRLILVMPGNRPQLPRLTPILNGIHPGVAWAVLLCAAIYLYCAVVPWRRRAEHAATR